MKDVVSYLSLFFSAIASIPAFIMIYNWQKTKKARREALETLDKFFKAESFSPQTPIESCTMSIIEKYKSPMVSTPFVWSGGKLYHKDRFLLNEKLLRKEIHEGMYDKVLLGK